MNSMSDAERLEEANAIIRELMCSLHALPCCSRDFMGDELWCRINRYFYGVDDPDVEEEDVETEEESI